jgi:hypothetical protein
MQEQYQDFIMDKAKRPAPPAEPVSGIATIVVAPGQGLAKVFESLGASAVVPGGQTMNPSTEQILHAVEAAPANEVIILPNNKNIVMAAEQCQSLTTKHVHVVRTHSVPQGIAALLALNYQADLATNAQVMGEAAQSVQTVEVTTAVRSVQIDGLPVHEGEAIGLINGKLKVKGETPEQVVDLALEHLHAQEFEIITLYYGEAVSPDRAQHLADRIGEQLADQEVEVVDGGQPHWHYILSVE